MIKISIRSTIIVLIQCIIPIFALLLFVPWLIQTQPLAQWQQTLSDFKTKVLLLHGLFYLAIILLWPTFVLKLNPKSELPPEQLSTLLNARWYLLSIFLCIDALMFWSNQ